MLCANATVTCNHGPQQGAERGLVGQMCRVLSQSNTQHTEHICDYSWHMPALSGLPTPLLTYMEVIEKQ